MDLFISFDISFVQMVLLQLFVKLVWFYFNLIPNYPYMVARNISLSLCFWEDSGYLSSMSWKQHSVQGIMGMELFAIISSWHLIFWVNSLFALPLSIVLRFILEECHNLFSCNMVCLFGADSKASFVLWCHPTGPSLHLTVTTWCRYRSCSCHVRQIWCVVWDR